MIYYYLTFFVILLLLIAYKYNSTLKIHHFYGKISKNDEELRDGLMHRKEKLGNNTGMLFPMKKQINSMWMKNTYIPLDIIFLDEKKRVVGYFIDAEPLSEKSLTIDKPSSYVLEMNGNSVFDLNIRIGDIILYIEGR